MYIKISKHHLKKRHLKFVSPYKKKDITQKNIHANGKYCT